MLCAPLVTRDSLVGVLKIAARYPEQLKPFDAELVEHFRSQAAIAIQNLHRTESLRARVVTAERKHAMADLARSVSHDVNNALGSMLPLIQQMQADLRSGARRADRVRGGSRARAEVAPGLPADFWRDADVFAECGAAERLWTGTARHRDGVGHPEVRHEPERHRAARERAGRDSGSRVQPERSRTGVPQPAHQRARGDAARRPDHGHRALGRSGWSRSRSPIPDAGFPRRICRGCSSRSSRPSRTATASACRSAARFSGKSTARSRFRASPATAPTSACSFRRRCRSHTAQWS